MRHIVVVGAGNVGQAVAARLHEANFAVQVLARRAVFAPPEGPIYTQSYADIWPTADLYILAVGDRDIAAAAETLAKHISNKSLVVHTSGATPATVLAPHFARYGVLWPLQTFTKGRKPDFSTMPAVLFSSENNEHLPRFADQIFSRTIVMDDEQRARLHVAAVMVNNFTNHLCSLAAQVSQSDWSLLLPLLSETVAKLSQMSPQQAQTGPAIRGDEATIARHVALLADQPDTTKMVYQTLTESIKITNQRDV